MSTISSIHEGTIAAKPFAHPDHGRIAGNHDHGRIGGNNDHGRIGGNNDHGRISGTHEHHSGGLRGKAESGGNSGATSASRRQTMRWPRSATSLRRSARCGHRRRASR